jgi:hypothetical protein
MYMIQEVNFDHVLPNKFLTALNNIKHGYKWKEYKEIEDEFSGLPAIKHILRASNNLFIEGLENEGLKEAE